MSPEQESAANSILSNIASEVEALRKSILSSNCEDIESHSHRALRLLQELRPLLAGGQMSLSTAVLELRDSVEDCAAVIKRVHRSVRALLSVHHSVSGRMPEGRAQF